jgi:nucleotide-binding universal stress UspA family protein
VQVPCQAVVVVGDPREEILKFVAKNPDVDLVVVGTRGIGAVAR